MVCNVRNYSKTRLSVYVLHDIRPSQKVSEIVFCFLVDLSDAYVCSFCIVLAYDIRWKLLIKPPWGGPFTLACFPQIRVNLSCSKAELNLDYTSKQSGFML